MTHILELPVPPADERRAYGEHPQQFGDLRLPHGPGPFPLVIYVHGGFWRARYDLSHAGHPCIALTAAGIATWNVEYRRIGNRGGGWPNTFRDVAAAAEYVRDLATPYNLDLDRVITVGHSAGGHLALWLAARHTVSAESPVYGPDPLRLRGAISLAGVVDLRIAWNLQLGNGVVRDLMGGTPDERPDRYAVASPAELVPLGIPQILVHGTDDPAVPYTVSAVYQEASLAAGDDVTLIPLDGAGHFELVDPRAHEWQTTLAAVRSLLP